MNGRKIIPTSEIPMTKSQERKVEQYILSRLDNGRFDLIELTVYRMFDVDDKCMGHVKTVAVECKVIDKKYNSLTERYQIFIGERGGLSNYGPKGERNGWDAWFARLGK